MPRARTGLALLFVLIASCSWSEAGELYRLRLAPEPVSPGASTISIRVLVDQGPYGAEAPPSPTATGIHLVSFGLSHSDLLLFDSAELGTAAVDALAGADPIIFDVHPHAAGLSVGLVLAADPAVQIPSGLDQHVATLHFSSATPLTPARSLAFGFTSDLGDSSVPVALGTRRGTIEPHTRSLTTSAGAETPGFPEPTEAELTVMFDPIAGLEEPLSPGLAEPMFAPLSGGSDPCDVDDLFIDLETLVAETNIIAPENPGGIQTAINAAYTSSGTSRS